MDVTSFRGTVGTEEPLATLSLPSAVRVYVCPISPPELESKNPVPCRVFSSHAWCEGENNNSNSQGKSRENSFNRSHVLTLSEAPLRESESSRDKSQGSLGLLWIVNLSGLYEVEPVYGSRPGRVVCLISP